MRSHLAKSLPRILALARGVLLLYYAALRSFCALKILSPSSPPPRGLPAGAQVVRGWRGVVAGFREHPAVNKAGYAGSKKGFMWYNFWWARCSYVAALIPPERTTRRHYYEVSHF